MTRKIARGLARAYVGLERRLYLGNLDALRDWGHARDYVEMQWMMLQRPEPEDFVIATGVQHSVRSFVEHAAKVLGITLAWQGQGIEEQGVVESAPADCALKPGHILVEVDPRYFRPAEVETLLGDPTRARERLGWQPRISFEELVTEMVQADLRMARRDALVAGAGYSMPSFRE